MYYKFSSRLWGENKAYLCKRRCDQKEFVASVESKLQIAKKEENMVTQKEVISLVKARKDVQELD